MGKEERAKKRLPTAPRAVGKEKKGKSGEEKRETMTGK